MDLVTTKITLPATRTVHLAVLALVLASGAVRAAEPLTVNLALGTDGKYVVDH